MEAGQARRRHWWPQAAVLLVGLVAGCASDRQLLDQTLRAARDHGTRPEDVAAAYRVSCPDVLEVRVAGRDDLAGERPIDPDGCLRVGRLGRMRVEGQTPAEVAAQVADWAAVPVGAVQVRVTAYRSQQLYLVGQVGGTHRPVPYEGPETVLELLQRVGVTAGAALEDVYVVRSHVPDGQPPEVFRVDLRAVLWGHDSTTNVRLLPFDEVFVGETRQCCWEKCVPPWLRPAYETVCGMKRPGS